MKVFRWDDDLAVMLPEDLVKELGLREGDEVEIVAREVPSQSLPTSLPPDQS